MIGSMIGTPGSIGVTESADHWPSQVSDRRSQNKKARMESRGVPSVLCNMCRVFFKNDVVYVQVQVDFSHCWSLCVNCWALSQTE